MILVRPRDALLTRHISPEELAALAGDGMPDIPASAANSITLLQPGSPQLSSSLAYCEGAAAGDFLTYAAVALSFSKAGFNFVPIGFELLVARIRPE